MSTNAARRSLGANSRLAVPGMARLSGRSPVRRQAPTRYTTHDSRPPERQGLAAQPNASDAKEQHEFKIDNKSFWFTNLDLIWQDFEPHTGMCGRAIRACGVPSEVQCTTSGTGVKCGGQSHTGLGIVLLRSSARSGLRGGQ